MIEHFATVTKFFVGAAPLAFMAATGAAHNEVDWGALLGQGGIASSAVFVTIWMRDRLSMRRMHAAEMDASRKRHELELDGRDRRHEAELASARESSRQAWATVERVRKERDESRLMCLDCPGLDARNGRANRV